MFMQIGEHRCDEDIDPGAAGGARCAPARCAGARAERPGADREDSDSGVGRSARSTKQTVDAQRMIKRWPVP